jgi:hypothetical protein
MLRDKLALLLTAPAQKQKQSCVFLKILCTGLKHGRSLTLSSYHLKIANVYCYMSSLHQKLKVLINQQLLDVV